MNFYTTVAAIAVLGGLLVGCAAAKMEEITCTPLKDAAVIVEFNQFATVIYSNHVDLLLVCK